MAKGSVHTCDRHPMGFTADMHANHRPANLLLGSFPESAYDRIAPHLEHVALERGKILHQPGEEIRDLYFPLDALISVTVTMRNGRTSETGVVGRREVVGINAFMGGRETTQTEYVVQVDGAAVRVAAEPLREQFDRDPALRHVLLGFTQAMFAQVTQNAACNSLHMLEQRYARWLLEVRDRIGADDLRLTHEFIAEMLGVRRAGITELANKFESEGLIERRNGVTRCVDVAGLEATACECYGVIRDEYDRLLSAAEAAPERAESSRRD
jgi:CRP-like cAMP-binding protein